MRTGDLIADRYELEALLGKGGMGQVWRARDVRLDRPVAIKVLAANLAAEPENLVRFFAEAQSVARISHRNVVTVLDFGETDGRPFLVMEYVLGGDLRDLIGEPLYESRAVELVNAAAAGAGAAHCLGIVHRDIKPSNILLDEDGQPKLADFGIAATSAGERLTVTGTAIGSPHYISPEQARGRSATPASDVYALGVVLFELLTGRKPFDAQNLTAIAIAHVEKPAPAPSSFVPGLSRDLEDIVSRCLAKDPAERFPTGTALCRALDSVEAEAVPLTRRAIATKAVATSIARASTPKPWPVAKSRQRPGVFTAVASRSGLAIVASLIVFVLLLAAGIHAVAGGPMKAGGAHAGPAHKQHARAQSRGPSSRP